MKVSVEPKPTRSQQDPDLDAEAERYLGVFYEEVPFFHAKYPGESLLFHYGPGGPRELPAAFKYTTVLDPGPAAPNVFVDLESEDGPPTNDELNAYRALVASIDVRASPRLTDTGPSRRADLLGDPAEPEAAPPPPGRKPVEPR